MSTALVDIFDDDNCKYSCRILLDSGSQPNIVSRDLANRLNCKKRKINLAVEVVNNIESACSEWVNLKLKSKCSNYLTVLSFLILPHITGNVPDNIVERNLLSIPKDIFLAHPDFHYPKKVDALIGAEVFYDLLLNGRLKLNNPGLGLQNTKLGWVVSGKLGGTWNQEKVHCHLVRGDLHEKVDKFWELEEVSDRVQISSDEELCETHFQKYVQRLTSGKFMLKLPFNGKKSLLGLSYEMARKRFFMLERRLEKNDDLKIEYHKFMSSYLDLNHMEPYRLFWIHPEDRMFQKIVWRWNQSQPLQTFQLKTVTYGTACAPFMATRCLKQLANEERDSYPLAAKSIEEDMYVDDLLTGANSVEEAKRLQDDIITITNRAGSVWIRRRSLERWALAGVRTRIR